MKLSIILPNIRSGFNVGSFFRMADGLGVSKIYLCGHTPYPPHKEIQKTALGAENFVNWEYHINVIDLISKLKEKGVHIVALEKTSKAIPLEEFYSKNNEICLIVGNEIDGISEEILTLSDDVLFIDMKGQKESLNVSVAGGIAIYTLLNLTKYK